MELKKAHEEANASQRTKISPFRPLFLALFVVFLTLPLVHAEAVEPLWQDVAEQSISPRSQPRNRPSAYRTVQLRMPALRQLLAQAPQDFTPTARTSAVEISVPMPDGTFARFRVVESPMMEPKLAAQHPEIKTYQAWGIDDLAAVMRFDLTMRGFHAIILSPSGTVHIEPYAEGDVEHYRSFFKRDAAGDDAEEKRFRCLTEEDAAAIARRAPPSPNFASFGVIHVYRLALAATAQYTNRFRLAGDSDQQARDRAFAAMTSTSTASMLSTGATSPFSWSSSRTKTTSSTLTRASIPTGTHPTGARTRLLSASRIRKTWMTRSGSLITTSATSSGWAAAAMLQGMFAKTTKARLTRRSVPPPAIRLISIMWRTRWGTSSGLVTPSITTQRDLAETPTNMWPRRPMNRGAVPLSWATRGFAAAGLVISSNNIFGETTRIRGLAIFGFAGRGIVVGGSGLIGPLIEGCYIGLKADGTAQGNGFTGVQINGAINVTVGGTNATRRNIISANNIGVSIDGSSATANDIIGNFIGTDVAGTARIPNVIGGVTIVNAPSNTVSGNVISGNGVNNFGADGIEIFGSPATGNKVLGNYLGLASDGVTPLGNLGSGVLIDNAPGTIIGGSAAGARNVITDNRGSGGIAFFGAGSSGATIEAITSARTSPATPRSRTTPTASTPKVGATISRTTSFLATSPGSISPSATRAGM